MKEKGTLCYIFQINPLHHAQILLVRLYKKNNYLLGPFYADPWRYFVALGVKKAGVNSAKKDHQNFLKSSAIFCVKFPIFVGKQYT